MAHAECTCAAGHAGYMRKKSHDNILASETCHEDNSIPKFGRENTGLEVRVGVKMERRDIALGSRTGVLVQMSWVCVIVHSLSLDGRPVTPLRCLL